MPRRQLQDGIAHQPYRLRGRALRGWVLVGVGGMTGIRILRKRDAVEEEVVDREGNQRGR